MNFCHKQIFLFALVLAPLLARAGGDEVVVIYNSNLPDSKMVAEHYAGARRVPANQIFGFALTTNDIISRDDFTEILQKPLAQKLVDAGLWSFGTLDFPADHGRPAHTENRIVKSKIRYAVLCYGMPLKIAPDSRVVEIVDKIFNTELRRNEAAVDSELAWLPLIKMDVKLTGPLPNPLYCTTNAAVLNPTNGILMVARLDGSTPQIANALVDKAMAAESNGFWGRAYFDARGLAKTDPYYLGDQWMLASAEICRLQGFDVETDTNAAVLPDTFPMSHIAIYAGWYIDNPSGPFKQAKMEFMPGAFAYHLHSFSADTLHSSTAQWAGPLLAKGATCTMGCVYEPFLQFTPNIAFFVQAFGGGYSFGEAAWACQDALSWQTTVVGDPLYQPTKKSPPELHAQLAREKNPLLEWSFNKLVNLDLARGVRPAQLAQFLENIPQTAQSAVLSEKLAQLYDALGKPSSAIDLLQRALKLNPSPQERIRLHLVLAEKLLAENRDADAAKNWRQLIVDSPDYPGLPEIHARLKTVDEKIAAAKKH